MNAIAAAAIAATIGCAFTASAGQAPPVPAQAAQDPEKPVLLLAAGGSAANVNDIAWVLTTEVFEHPKTKKRIDRKVLLCYKVGQNGKLIDIVDVRDITWDAKFEQLSKNGHDSDHSPEQLRKQWEKILKTLGEGN
jgi:hypothetical protein